jgi:hypothetical protein
MQELKPYVFQEFPKWVTIGENEPVLCETKEAELLLIGEAPEVAEKPKRGRPAKAD